MQIKGFKTKLASYQIIITVKYCYNIYEGTNMVYKCKVFEIVYLTLHGHFTHVCTVSNLKYGCQIHSKYTYYC